MNTNKESILQLINNVFEKSYFYDQGSEKTILNISKQIDLFKKKYPSLLMNFLQNIKQSFPDAKIENFTHFFYHDRCLRFLVEITEKFRFVCQLSIFNFFSVYQHPITFQNGKYEYEDLTFINKNESDICNKLYSCTNVRSEEWDWLDRDLLTTVIDDFSILTTDAKFNYKITIADALFTTHYI